MSSFRCRYRSPFKIFSLPGRVSAVLTFFLRLKMWNYTQNLFLPPLGLKGMLSNLKILPSGVGGASSSEKCHFCVAVCFLKCSVAKSIANYHVWDNGKSKNWSMRSRQPWWQAGPSTSTLIICMFLHAVHFLKIWVAKPLQTAYTFAHAQRKIFAFKGRISKTCRQ